MTPDASRTVPLVRLDLALPTSSPDPLADVMREHGVTSVIHLAARKQVAESVERPLWYYDQNLSGLAHVLSAMETATVGVDRLLVVGRRVRRRLRRAGDGGRGARDR